MTDPLEILKQLKSQDSEVLREAAFMAGESVLREAVPLLAELLDSHSLGVQEAADQALRQIGGKEAIEAVIPHLRSESAPQRNLAMDILREIGVQDFRSLFDLLHDEDPDIRIFAADILGATKSVLAVNPLCGALLKDPEVNVRYQAAISLGTLGFPQATKALIAALNDEEWVQFAVVGALSSIRDPSSVSALVKATEKSSSLVASMIAEALGEIGDIKTVGFLIKRLDTSSTALRNKIVKAIVKIMGGKLLTLLSKKEQEDFRDYLIAALKDDDESVQHSAVTGLAYVGGITGTKAIFEYLETLSTDKDSEDVEHVIAKLTILGYNEAMAEALKSSDTPLIIQEVVIEALNGIGGDKVNELLLSVFWDKERDIQRLIMQALLNTGGQECVNFCEHILEKHQDGEIIKAALAILGPKLKSHKSEDKIFALLSHPYDDVKDAALDACVALGGAELQEKFRKMVVSPEPIERLMATYALGGIDALQNVDYLRNALEDDLPDIRKVALEALADIEDPALDVSALIASKLNDENKEVRLAAVELLGRLRTEESASYIVQALDDDDDWVRIRAIEALGDMGSEEVVPLLVRFLEEPYNKLVILKTIDALSRIGGNMAFKSLLEILSSEDPDLQLAAEEAIAQLNEQQD